MPFYSVTNLNTQYIKNRQDRYASLPAIDSLINFISMTLISKAKNNGIKSTIVSLIAMSFIVGLNGSKSIIIFTYLYATSYLYSLI